MIFSLSQALLICFVAWVEPHSFRRYTELSVISEDIASTDANEDEALLLASIAMHETMARLDVVGKLGERGAFQVMPPGDPHAKEALRRLRVQGLQGYAGCQKPCPQTVNALRAYAN